MILLSYSLLIFVDTVPASFTFNIFPVLKGLYYTNFKGFYHILR